MTLEDTIYKSILTYPSLYYRKDFQKSRLLVLDHIFLTLGNGREFAYTKDPNEGGYITTDKYYKKNGDYVRKYDLPYGKEKVPQEIKDKINKGIRLYEVVKTRDEASNRHYPELFGRKERNYIFEDESPIIYPLAYSEIVGEKSDFCVRVFPEEDEFKWKPYPFSLWFSPFVEINENRKKYTYETIHEITVEELRESKALIKEDWVKGIVEIFSHTLNWFESDEFWTDSYYNWSLEEDNSFVEKFNKAKEENFSQFCEDHLLPDGNYPTCKDFALACVIKNRNRYISDCKKIIEAFS